VEEISTDKILFHSQVLTDLHSKFVPHKGQIPIGKAIFIDNKKNKGKAACLNQGISVAKGEYVACMDADSVVSKDILKKTIPYFKNDEIGAVTVSVEVKHVNNFLQKIIQLEYILGLSLFLRILSSFHWSVCCH